MLHTPRWTLVDVRRGVVRDRLFDILERGTTERGRISFWHAGFAEMRDDIFIGFRRWQTADQAIATDALVLLELLTLALDLGQEDFLEPAR